MARNSVPLRAQRSSSEDVDEDELNSSPPGSPQRSDTNSEPEHAASTDGIESENEEPEQQEDFHEDLQHISFGALAQAQGDLALSRSKYPKDHINRQQDGTTDVQKINTLRERLAELKRLKGSFSKAESDIISEESKGPSKRSSKHAPAEQSSRRAVTRKRPVLDVSQNPYHSRDPRFSATTNSGQPNDEAAKRKYAFLKSYRDDELSELKNVLAAVKARKNKRKSKALTADEEHEVQQLKRQINSIENRIKSEAEKERYNDVAKRHKKEERERIKQGKKPFYLKQSELKERALKEKFDGMKAKEREKAVERRRKKLSQRERRSMPNARRQFNES